MTSNLTVPQEVADDEIDLLDKGSKDIARVPSRMCCATREVLPISLLIRCVKSPDGVLVADLKRNLPGRGIWVRARKSAIEQAIKKQAFARGLKSKVQVPPEFAADIEAHLKLSLLNQLKMANKAGAMITGAHAIEMNLPRPMMLLFHTIGASADGINKLESEFARQKCNFIGVNYLTEHDFSLVFGASHAIHAAVLRSQVGDAVLKALKLWLNFAEVEPLHMQLRMN